MGNNVLDTVSIEDNVTPSSVTNIDDGNGGDEFKKLTEKEIQVLREKNFHKASNFLDYVELIYSAEMILKSLDYENEENISIIRGIYYGTEWSLDYDIEKSKVRNKAFGIYTGESSPKDPRHLLGSKLYLAIKASAEVVSNGYRVDFGHMFIGMDARNRSIPREIDIPTQGGSGLEISTWLGDLGGGCGMLALKRVSNPNLKVDTIFRGSSYGGEVNLEGDVAAYLVATDYGEDDDPSSCQIMDSEFISSYIKRYLPINKSLIIFWKNRVYSFAKQIHAEFENFKISNLEDFKEELKEKIVDFSEWYLVNRVIQKNKASIKLLKEASAHIKGISEEITTVLVDTIEYYIQPENNLKGFKAIINNISPTPKGEPFSKYEGLENIKDLIDEFFD